MNLCVCASFPFGSEVGMWDQIKLISDHCLSIYCVPFCSIVMYFWMVDHSSIYMYQCQTSNTNAKLASKRHAIYTCLMNFFYLMLEMPILQMFCVSCI